jgi:hypothetical protein
VIYRLGASVAQAASAAVMVRAVGDEPRAFIAIAAGQAVVEVVDEDPEKHASIGVPRRRVFVHDERLFRKLLLAYARGQHDALKSLWAHATVADLSRLPPMAAAIEPRSHPS